jgi:CRISPR-associated protein Csb1
MSGSIHKSITLDEIHGAITGSAAALRCITELQPAGNAGDKIFPPTYEGGKYAWEKRRLPDAEEPVECVLLNSVQSEANRFELALLGAWQDGRIAVPIVTVDFSGADLPKTLRVTSLEAPHRIADALLRDSMHDGVAFRKSKWGQQLDDVDPRNATALFALCPTTLVFGMWDSTGPKGGLGAKFARAIVSEIIGIDAERGVRTSSRIDPAQIMLQAGPLYKAKGGGWTLDEKDAVREKNKPVKLGKDGKPSEANHGNVTPTIADGGVTIRAARQTTVLSLPALRRLRFPLRNEGRSDPKVDEVARTALAALALCAAELAREQGYDLRSRCQLHPVAPPIWQLVDAPASPPREFSLDGKTAVALYQAAIDEARKVGLPMLDQELVLQPSPQLAALVRKSQELAAKIDTSDEED